MLLAGLKMSNTPIIYIACKTNRNMRTILNLTSIKEKMKNKPKGQNIYMFFKGAKSVLSDEEKSELLDIIESNNKDVVEFIKSSL